MMNIRVKLIVYIKSLVKKLKLNFRKNKVIDLIIMNGKKNKICGMIEETIIKIADTSISMNIHIVDSKDKTFLIDRD